MRTFFFNRCDIQREQIVLIGLKRKVGITENGVAVSVVISEGRDLIVVPGRTSAASTITRKFMIAIIWKPDV